MQIRFAARQVERLCDSVRCEVDNIRPDRAQDPGPRREQGRHAAPRFHQEVSGARNLAALDRPRDRRASSATARRSRATGRRSSSSSRRLLDLQKRVMIPLEGPEGDQQADVHGRGEGAQGQARDDRGQPAPRDLDRQEVHQPRPAVPRPDPGRQHRPDEGGRQVRIPPRLQVLDLRHVVDPARRSRARSPTRRAPSASRCT
mgnify:CR=1 FL=1